MLQGLGTLNFFIHFFHLLKFALNCTQEGNSIHTKWISLKPIISHYASIPIKRGAKKPDCSKAPAGIQSLSSRRRAAQPQEDHSSASSTDNTITVSFHSYRAASNSTRADIAGTSNKTRDSQANTAGLEPVFALCAVATVPGSIGVGVS